MPSLSVTEKEHWKERIARKLDAKIETVAAADPGLLDLVGRQARQRAMKSLGLVDIQAELDALAIQKEDLEKRERQGHRALLAVIRRVPVEEVNETYFGRPHPEVARAVQARQAMHEAELLAEDERGREILRLRREKENLLDTVWLATSPQQVKELWRKVAELLGEEPTALQREALAIGTAGAE